MDYENLLHDLEDKLEAAERRLEVQQRECYEKVGSATELAEKQNALTMTLEAKVRQFLSWRVKLFSFTRFFFFKKNIFCDNCWFKKNRLRSCTEIVSCGLPSSPPCSKGKSLFVCAC